jgi:hypothetical protein
MSNMSYCRFQNTVADLRDCYEHMELIEGHTELDARQVLIKLCVDLAIDYGHEIGRQVEEVD